MYFTLPSIHVRKYVKATLMFVEQHALHVLGVDQNLMGDCY